MKKARGIGGNAPTDVVCQGKIQRIFSGRSKPNELDRISVQQKFFDEGGIKLGLFRSHQQSEADRFLPDHRKIDVLDVFKINEHVIDHKRNIHGEVGQVSNGKKSAVL